MILTTRPIDRWPNGPLTPWSARKRSNFSATYGTTLALLDRELEFLRASHPVLQIAIQETDLKLNGEIRAQAKPEHPGVVLAFDSKHGPLKYATDVFDRWQDNLRAIALALEALRKVDRYGVGARGEQYTGWRALPSGLAMPAHAGFASIEEAGRFLLEIAEDDPGFLDDILDPDGPDLLSGIYKQAAKHAHPDAGGSDELMARVTAARDYLQEQRT